MRPLLLTLLLAVLLLLVGYWINTYAATHCTRYCTLHGCRHATAANNPASAAEAGVRGHGAGVAQWLAWRLGR